MNGGESRNFEYDAATSFKVGEKVKVVNNRLVMRE